MLPTSTADGHIILTLPVLFSRLPLTLVLGPLMLSPLTLVLVPLTISPLTFVLVPLTSLQLY